MYLSFIAANFATKNERDQIASLAESYNGKVCLRMDDLNFLVIVFKIN